MARVLMLAALKDLVFHQIKGEGTPKGSLSYRSSFDHLVLCQSLRFSDAGSGSRSQSGTVLLAVGLDPPLAKLLVA